MLFVFIFMFGRLLPTRAAVETAVIVEWYLNVRFYIFIFRIQPECYVFNGDALRSIHWLS